MKQRATFFVWLLFTLCLSEAFKFDTMFYTWLTLPGTALHESAHYFVAWLLGGEPFGFSVIPQKLYIEGELAAILQGHVLFHITDVDAAASALAPLTLLPFPFFFVSLLFRTKSLAWQIIFLYFAMCAWASILPSEPDFKIALEVPASWLEAAIVLPVILILNSVCLKFLASRYNR